MRRGLLPWLLLSSMAGLICGTAVGFWHAREAFAQKDAAFNADRQWRQQAIDAIADIPGITRLAEECLAKLEQRQ